MSGQELLVDVFTIVLDVVAVKDADLLCSADGRLPLVEEMLLRTDRLLILSQLVARVVDVFVALGARR